MIKFILYIIFLFCILSCVSRSKKSKKSQKKYCQYVEQNFEIESRKFISNYDQFRNSIGLKNGEVVADVGAANGYIDIMMSLATDSVTYYIQDISKENINSDNFDNLCKVINRNQNSPQTNKFHLVLGTERYTLLPDTMFDKIFLFNSLHEFTYVKDMMDDLYKKLKYNGEIIIGESLSEIGKKYLIEGCNTVAFTESEIAKIMRDSNFNTNYKLYSDSTFGTVLIFSKNLK